MKFSTKAEYGLRAIVHLDKAGKKPVSLASIAKIEKLSLPYLERIFSELKKAGLIISFIGTNGGYVLSKSSVKIKVSEVIEALEGPLFNFKCAGCSMKGCAVNPVWQKLYAQIYKTLNSITLNSLIK